jgi:REP element-mobilizing transposase RayT
MVKESIASFRKKVVIISQRAPSAKLTRRVLMIGPIRREHELPSTYTNLLVHIVFSTKNRELLIADSWRQRLHEYLGGTVAGLGGTSQGVGGVADHVHLLVALKPVHRLSDFVRELKKSSSNWVKAEFGAELFAWQEGYAAFSLGYSARVPVQNYIGRQEEHHRTRTFRDELIDMLKSYGVNYDERRLD